MRRIILLFIILAVALAIPAAVLADLFIWPSHSTNKVRPFDFPGADTAMVLYSAQNEWEAGQVIVSDNAGVALTGCDVIVSPLSGPGDDIEQIELYRETYVYVAKPSYKPHSPDVIGYWPDGMIPFVDAYYGQARNGAPFDVEAGWNQPIWIDIFVPAGQDPGEYEGTISVSCDDRATKEMSLYLTVWDFELPNAITLPSSYGYSCSSVQNKHTAMGGDVDPDRKVITRLYFKEALKHRMMFNSGQCVSGSWSWDGGSQTGEWDFSEFDAEMTPAFDGTLYKPDVSFDTYRMPYPSDSATHEEQVAFWGQFADHFRAKGWLEKAYLYLPDEPTPDQYPHLVELAATLHEGDPDLQAMATEQIDPGLIGSVDIWCPDEPLFSDSLPYPPWPEDYPPRQALGEKIWWYNCTSAQVVHDYSSHFVDAVGMSQRVWQWLTRRYNFDGLLFWHSVWMYGHVDDPWEDQYARDFLCNGDGTMFYPGVTTKIGGDNDIPCASVRLKLFREGMEDYEYFHILDGLGHADFVQNEVEKIAPKTFQWEHDPLVMERSRHKIAAMILGTFDTDPPDAPAGLGAFGGPHSVTVTWTPNDETDVTGYEVSLSRYPDERIIEAVLASRTLSAEFSGLEPTKPYYLTVRAIDQSGNYSTWAQEVVAAPEFQRSGLPGDYEQGKGDPANPPEGDNDDSSDAGEDSGDDVPGDNSDEPDSGDAGFCGI